MDKCSQNKKKDLGPGTKQDRFENGLTVALKIAGTGLITRLMTRLMTRLIHYNG